MCSVRAASHEQARRGVVLAPADPDGEHARAVVALMELAETTEAAAAAEAAEAAEAAAAAEAAEAAEAAAAAAAAEAASPEAEAGQEPAAADVKPTSQSRRDFDYNFAVSQRAIRSSTCQTRRPVSDSPLTPATEYGRYTREQIEDREVTITDDEGSAPAGKSCGRKAGALQELHRGQAAHGDPRQDG